ncbi:hypothetical protein Mext_0355 [Methylorubrum extorquens PA1]|jgi:hypothetical protein|nr:hypothetical protein Mext_0355 [Methylorubrum extorquens PA1]
MAMPSSTQSGRIGRGKRMLVYDPDPANNERIRRAVRYGQTRWAEIWL